MRDFDYPSAHDLHMHGAERRCSVRREPGLLAMLPCHLWWGLVRVYLRLWHRLEIHGKRHLPAEPFIMIANHSSHLDAMVLGVAIHARARRRTFPVAAGDVFFESRKAQLYATLCLNALPLWRKKAGRHALNDLRQRIEAGDTNLILFPEGTRSPDGTLQAFKPGIGMLVAGSDVPVVPCHITGAFHAMPKGCRLPRPSKLRLHIGRPLQFNGVTDDRDGWSHIAKTLQIAVENATP